MAVRTRPRQNPDMEANLVESPPTEEHLVKQLLVERIPDMTDKTLSGETIPHDVPGMKYKTGTWDQAPHWMYGLLNANEFILYMFLHRRGGFDRKIFCSQQDISKHTLMSESTIRRTSNSLKGKGLLTWEKIKTSGAQKYPTNSYILHVPAEFAENLELPNGQKGKVPAQRGSQKSSQHKEDPVDRACRIGTLEAFLEAFPDRPGTAELYYQTYLEQQTVTA